MRSLRVRLNAVLSLLALVCLLVSRVQAQSLTYGLFDRYLDALRQEMHIPGLSVALVQNGRIVFDDGLGLRDIAASQSAEADTPYPIANLTETFGATLMLQQCIDRGDEIELSDRVVRWTPFSEPTSTIAQVLGHVTPAGTYKYDSPRFGALSGVIVECVDQPFPRILATQLLDRLAMTDSVPGRDAIDAPNAQLFSAAVLDRYRSVLARTAAPHRIDSKGTATRSTDTLQGLTASAGIVSTVRDLAKFDAALNDGILLSPESRAAMWTPGAARPTSLGWFVQTYNGERLIWHFGLVKDAYSSLIIKVPGRQLTLILLANSDGLTSSFSPADGDVTQSIFARLFLRLFVS